MSSGVVIFFRSEVANDADKEIDGAGGLDVDEFLGWGFDVGEEVGDLGVGGRRIGNDDLLEIAVNPRLYCVENWGVFGVLNC